MDSEELRKQEIDKHLETLILRRASEVSGTSDAEAFIKRQLAMMLIYIRAISVARGEMSSKLH